MKSGEKCSAKAEASIVVAFVIMAPKDQKTRFGQVSIWVKNTKEELFHDIYFSLCFFLSNNSNLAYAT